MPHWFQHAQDGAAGWIRCATPPDAPGVAIEQTREGPCLLSAPGARAWVNGLPVAAGAKAVMHRDEIRFSDGTTVHYTAEDPPVALEFSGAAAKCGRCRTPIAEGALAVRCQCGVWYHQGDPSCFEYGEKPLCVACRRPTRMDDSALWRPEEET